MDNKINKIIVGLWIVMVFLVGSIGGILIGSALGRDAGYGIAQEDAKVEIHALEVEIENLERAANIPLYQDPDIQTIELMEQLIEGLESSSGTIKIDSDGKGSVEITYKYERE